MTRILSAVLYALIFLSPAFQAHAEDISTEEIYRNLRSAESGWNREQSALTSSLTEQKPKCGPGSHDFYCETENSKALFLHTKTLEMRAENGDALASFYLGVLALERAESLSKMTSHKSSIGEYENAMRHFKSACTSNISSACWNVGTIYLNGSGEVKSSLAAAEWFYRAGIGYQADGDRERSLAALEAIDEIDPKHALGKKLRSKLNMTAQKTK